MVTDSAIASTFLIFKLRAIDRHANQFLKFNLDYSVHFAPRSASFSSFH